MRLITGSPFSWCDVTETGPCCESLPLPPHTAKITCLLPFCAGTGLPTSPWSKDPRAVEGRVSPEPFSSSEFPLSIGSVSRRSPARRLPAGQVPRRWQGLAWHGLVRRRGPAGRCQERVSGCLSAALKRHRLALSAVPRDRLKMHGPM